MSAGTPHAGTPLTGAWRLRARQTAGALSLCLGALCTPNAWADIRFEDRGERFSLDVRDEPIAKVMDKLSERFEFDVDGYPEHWSDKPISFSTTGDLERVLRSVLKDTSHVFEYHTDPATKQTRIAALKLLNEGVEGFVPTQTRSSSASSSPTPPVASGRSGNKVGSFGNERDRMNGQAQSRELLEGDIASRTSENSSENSDGNGASAPGQGSARASGLSRSLEARARQSSAAAAGAAGSTSTSQSVTANPTTGVSNADMQALTQKALQDVQGLAEALKKAEGKN